jgi:hypothetical protein
MALMFCIGLLPLTAFRETRGPSGVAFYIISFIFGATLWVRSLLLTYILWGGFALLVGLFLGGVGVLPIALLATALKREWAIFGQLILLGVAVLVTRYSGFYLVVREELRRDEAPQENSPNPSHKLILASWFLFAASFVPYIAYVTSLPMLASALVLCFSKSPRAKRHGRIILLLCLLISATFFLIGYFYFAGVFPPKG